MEIDELKEKAGDLADHVVDYAETFYKVALLNMTQKATNIASTIVTVVALCTLGMFVLFFITLALGWWLGDLINSRAGGFLIVAALFLVLLFVIISMRKKIVFPFIRNLIIRQSYD